MRIDRPRVLVVEDEPSVLEPTAAILEASCAVTTAVDGAAALRLVEAEPFEVVLTDLRMPGATGFDVLRAVQLNAGTRCEVVLMTAHATVADAVAAMRLGAYDYVPKPFDADELSLVVARAVEHLREALEEARALRVVRAEEEPDADVATSLGFRGAVEEARSRASRAYLGKLLRLCHGDVTLAARRAGMTRESLRRVLERYAVRPERERLVAGNVIPIDPARRVRRRTDPPIA